MRWIVGYAAVIVTVWLTGGTGPDAAVAEQPEPVEICVDEVDASTCELATDRP